MSLSNSTKMAEAPPLKISLESLGLTLSTVEPSTSRWSWPEPSMGESLQQSFVFISNGEDDESGSIVVLGNSSLDAVRAESLATFERINKKSEELDCGSIISSLAPSEVEKKLTELLRENLRLKETLELNSQAMKLHLTSMMNMQEEATKVQKTHKEKFAETKALVAQLKVEAGELKAEIEELKAKAKEERMEEKETQTEKAQEESTEDEPSTIVRVNEEFARETLRLAEKCEEQAKEIAQLRAAVGSGSGQIETFSRGLFSGLKLEELTGNATSQDSFLKTLEEKLESLRTENTTLDEAKASLTETVRNLGQERKALEEERQRWLKEQEASAAEKLRLREEERKLIEANASLNEELGSQKEVVEVLRHQLRIYEEDFAQERELRQKMMAERTDLLEHMSYLNNENASLVSHQR